MKSNTFAPYIVFLCASILVAASGFFFIHNTNTVHNMAIPIPSLIALALKAYEKKC